MYKRQVLYDYRQTINDLLINHYAIRWQHGAAKQGKGIRNQAHGSPAKDVYKRQVEHWPEQYSEAEYGRATKYAAAHLLAKIYLNRYQGKRCV